MSKKIIKAKLKAKGKKWLRTMIDAAIRVKHKYEVDGIDQRCSHASCHFCVEAGEIGGYKVTENRSGGWHDLFNKVVCEQHCPWTIFTDGRCYESDEDELYVSQEFIKDPFSFCGEHGDDQAALVVEKRIEDLEDWIETMREVLAEYD